MKFKKKKEIQRNKRIYESSYPIVASHIFFGSDVYFRSIDGINFTRIEQLSDTESKSRKVFISDIFNEIGSDNISIARTFNLETKETISFDDDYCCLEVDRSEGNGHYRLKLIYEN